MRFKLLTLVVALTLSLGLVEGFLYKKLNGPPNEPQLVPEPHEAAIHSNHALYDVSLGEEVHILVDSDKAVIFSIFCPKEYTATIQPPSLISAVAVEDFAAAIGANIVADDKFGVGETSFPAKSYEFESPEIGEWTLTLVPADTADVGTEAFVLVGNIDAPTVSSSVASYDALVVGDEVTVDAWPDDVSTAVGSVVLEVTPPSSAASISSTMTKAGEVGVYHAAFLAQESGTYQTKVTFTGVGPTGVPYLRTVHNTVAIVQPSVTGITSASAAPTVAGEAPRARISLHIARGPGSDPTVRAYADVYGMSVNGSMVPVAWIAGLADIRDDEGDAVLDLELDSRWLALAAAAPPLELRNIVVQDRIRFIPIARATRLKVEAETAERIVPADVHKWKVREITTEMLHGRVARRPLNSTSSSRGAALVLSHGYCADGNPWRGTKDFSGNYVKYSDPSASRPIDVFARGVLNAFDSQLNSFGFVGHSQGGMVGAHIYAYYSSGLDHAGPESANLIQSVGTPYRGCPLAGLLAKIGDIFGAGCGVNDDLTYDGARRWLAGIPDSVRRRVTYVTTQYSKSATVRYCSLAANAVLSWPNDGVTEVKNGQLAGGNNQGNIAGWCHTSSMRYPAQYTDRNVNTFFDSKAAR